MSRIEIGTEFDFGGVTERVITGSQGIYYRITNVESWCAGEEFKTREPTALANLLNFFVAGKTGVHP